MPLYQTIPMSKIHLLLGTGFYKQTHIEAHLLKSINSQLLDAEQPYVVLNAPLDSNNSRSKYVTVLSSGEDTTA